MSANKLFGKDIFISSTTNASGSTIGSISTLGGLNVNQTVLISGALSSIANSNTIGNLFTTGGNVGVGTTSPVQRLDVNGNLNFTGNLYQNGSVYSGSTQWGSTGANIYFNTGNVGIGTTTATYTLDVNGSTRIGNSAGNTIQNYDNLILTPLSGQTATEILFNPAPGPFRNWIYSASPGGMAIGGNGGLAFQTGPSGGSVSTNMFVATTGNVGVGTIFPSTKLHLKDTGSVTLLLEADHDNITETDVATIQLRQDGGLTGADIGINGSNDTYIKFNTGTTKTNDFYIYDDNTTRMYINSGGNTGIGTTSPIYTLDVNGTFEASNSNGLMLFASSGNVGIGTTSPIAKLSVDFSGITQNQNVLSLHTSNTATSDYNLIEAGHGTSTNFVLKGNGNLGIGTTTPRTFLHFGSAVINSPRIMLFGTDTTSGYHGIAQGGSSLQLTVPSSGSHFISFGSNTGGNFSEQMRIQNNGNVGIGTTSPNDLLTVRSGVIQVGGIPNQGSSGGFRVLRLTPVSGSATQITFDTSISTGSTQNYVYSDNTIMEISAPKYNIAVGNVGIGTASPSERLHINGSLLLEPQGTSNTSGRMRITSTGAVNYIQSGLVGSNSAELRIGPTYTSTPWMTLTSSGNVGIGTASPGMLLEIRGTLSSTTREPMLRMGRRHNSGVSFAASAEFDVYKASYTVSADASTALTLRLGDGASDNPNLDIMTLWANGRVGIGTVSPATILDIGGSSNNIGIGRARNYGGPHDSGNRDGLYFGRWDGGVGGGTPHISGPTGEYTGMACRVVTGSSVGESFDNQAIISFYTWGNSVSGSREVMRITQRGACLNLANSYGALSDQRIKENIEDARNYLDDLKRVRVVKYSLKEENQSQADKLGVIAQEIKEIFPGMTDSIEYGDYQDLLTVKMTVFIPMLIKSIQELDNKINNLKDNYNEQIQKLENDNLDLIAKNNEQNQNIDKLISFIESKFPGELI